MFIILIQTEDTLTLTYQNDSYTFSENLKYNDIKFDAKNVKQYNIE